MFCFRSDAQRSEKYRERQLVELDRQAARAREEEGGFPVKVRGPPGPVIRRRPPPRQPSRISLWIRQNTLTSGHLLRLSFHMMHFTSPHNYRRRC